MSIKEQQLKKLTQLIESGGKDSDLVILDEIDALEEKIDKTKEKLEQKFDETVKEIKDNVPDLNKILETVKGKDGKDSIIPGPKGDKGEKGEQGQQGIQGLKGDKGDNGNKGEQGEQGTAGIDGKNGDLKDLSPDEIRNSLELLQGDERLDIKAVKGMGIDDIKNLIAEDISRIPALVGSGMVEVYDANGKIDSSSRLRFTGATVTYDTDGAIKIAIAGGSGYQAPTGTVDGVNKVFVFTTAPNSIVVDGQSMRKTTSDGTVNWTVVGSTITLIIAPNFDIFATS